MKKGKLSYTLLIRGILILIGVVGLFLFIYPLMRKGSLNIGGMTGTICSFILLIYGSLMPVCNKGIAFLYRKALGRVLCNVVMVGILLIVIMTVAETISMCSINNKKIDEDAVVVVLGCRIYGSAPSLSMVERLDAAYDYLTEHEDKMCILSGGKGVGEEVSEAQCMYDYLINKGIDANRLVIEGESKDTYENLTNVAKIMEDRNWGNSVAIVTSEYHEYRSSMIASDVGLEACAIPARTAWWLFPTYYVRELYGILHQWMFGR